MRNFIRAFYSNEKLEIHEQIPNYGHEVSLSGLTKDWKEIKEQPEKLDHPFYHCRYCKGYIEGLPYNRSENTIGPLAGRKGRSYGCIRCGKELAFIGYRS